MVAGVQQIFAQHSDSENLKQLNFYQDSLKHLGSRFVNDEVDVNRKAANYQFIKTLVTALKTPNSFLFKFDSLKAISIVNSPDNRFRIFSWHIINMDGSHRFYGAIQMNTGGPLKLIPLEDYSPLLKNPEDSVTNNRKWYGAQYYQIIPMYGTNPYYVLLGWKGNTVKSTKKVIEVLSFKNDQPLFGMPVFEARAIGCRVVATDSPELREAGGEDATYVQPTPESIAAGLEIALSRARPSPSSSLGHDWGDAAKVMAGLLQSAADKPKRR